jgi:hypothetical protein
MKQKNNLVIGVACLLLILLAVTYLIINNQNRFDNKNDVEDFFTSADVIDVTNLDPLIIKDRQGAPTIIATLSSNKSAFAVLTHNNSEEFRWYRIRQADVFFPVWSAKMQNIKNIYTVDVTNKVAVLVNPKSTPVTFDVRIENTNFSYLIDGASLGISPNEQITLKPQAKLMFGDSNAISKLSGLKVIDGFEEFVEVKSPGAVLNLFHFSYNEGHEVKWLQQSRRSVINKQDIEVTKITPDKDYLTFHNNGPKPRKLEFTISQNIVLKHAVWQNTYHTITYYAHNNNSESDMKSHHFSIVLGTGEEHYIDVMPKTSMLKNFTE